MTKLYLFRNMFNAEGTYAGEALVMRWPISTVSHMSPEGLIRDVLLSRYETRTNKAVAVTALNTWYWAAVVGDNGQMRGKPRLFRHTVREGKAFWAVVKNESGPGYRLVPHKVFHCTCNCAGESFDRYDGQMTPNMCEACRDAGCMSM